MTAESEVNGDERRAQQSTALNTKERGQVKQAAHRRRVSISEFIRVAALKEAARVLRGESEAA